MRTPFYKGGKLLLAALAASLLAAAALGGAASAWSGGEPVGDTHQGTHAGVDFDKSKSQVNEHNQTSIGIDVELNHRHGDKGQEHGKVEGDHGATGEYGHKGHEHGDVEGDHGQNGGHGGNDRPCKKG